MHNSCRYASALRNAHIDSSLPMIQGCFRGAAFTQLSQRWAAATPNSYRAALVDVHGSKVSVGSTSVEFDRVFTTADDATTV